MPSASADRRCAGTLQSRVYALLTLRTDRHRACTLQSRVYEEVMKVFTQITIESSNTVYSEQATNEDHGKDYR